MIEPVYGMTRPAPGDNSRRARTYRATYELHDRAGEFTSVLLAQKHFPTAYELLLGGSIFPAMQNFLLAARAQGLGACLAAGRPTTVSDCFGTPSGCPRLAGRRPRRRRVAHGQTRAARRRPLAESVNLDHWDGSADDLLAASAPTP